MKLTDKQKIKDIVTKLWDKRLLDLSSSEICIYVLYRVEQLIKSNMCVHYNEIKHNLCEVGPGKRRIDPLTMNIVLNSKYFQELATITTYKKNDLIFYIRKTQTNSKMIDDIIDFKANIIENIYKSISSNKTLSNIQKLITSSINRNNCILLKSEINLKDNYIESVINIKDTKKHNILIRFYNINKCIYPDSYEIWSLYHKAFQADCIPVLIAPNIHGTCFQLFKSIGAFARASYFLFLNTDFNKLIAPVISSQEYRALYPANVSIGRFENSEPRLAYGEFEILSKILSSTIPKYFDTCLLNFKKSSKKIIPLLDNNFKIFLTNNNSDDLNYRVSKIEEFIKLARLSGIHNIRKAVKHYKKLIFDLNNKKIEEL